MIFIGLSILLLHSSDLLASPLYRSIIQRRQLLDGTAKSGGVAPKPPGSSASDSNLKLSTSFQFSTSQTRMAVAMQLTTTTMIMFNDQAGERSMKETSNSNSKSNGGLIAAIAAPTGIVGIVGALIGAYFYKKNQSNSSANPMSSGLFNQFLNFGGNSIV